MAKVIGATDPESASLIESRSDSEHDPLYQDLDGMNSGRGKISKEGFCFSCHLLLRMIFGLFLFVAVSGVVFGYNGFKPILIENRMFFDKFCSSPANSTSSLPPLGVGNRTTAPTCPKQILYLNSIFQTTVIVMNFATPVAGFFVSYCASQTVAYAVGAVGTFLSFALFGAVVSFRFFDQWFWWLAHVAYSGMGSFGCLMLFAFYAYLPFIPRKEDGHPKLAVWSGVVNSIVTSAWDLSSAVPYLLQVVFLYGRIDTIWIIEIPLAVLAVYAFGFLFFLRIPPSVIPKPVNTSLLALQESVALDSEKSESSACKKFCDLLKDCGSSFRMWQFYIQLVWMFVFMLQVNFFVSTVYDQAVWLRNGDIRRATLDNTVFSILLPALGFAWSPFAGLLLSNLPVAIFCLTSLDIIWSILACVPNPWVQYATYIFLILHRLFGFSVNTALSLRWWPETGLCQAGMTIAFGGFATLLGMLLNWLGMAVCLFSSFVQLFMSLMGHFS